MASLVPIPHPPGYPLVGNIFDLDPEAPLLALEDFAKVYGEIYSLTFFGNTVNVVNSHALALEILDERRFHKTVHNNALEEIRALTGDALFTAYHGEETWGVAHRILIPAFGPASIIGMFDDMYDILSQLVLKWERFGPKHPIDPADDFTRLAFDTIAYCAMGHRLNSFYTEGVPPFVEAMGSFLRESDGRANRPRLLTWLMRKSNAKFEEDRRMMNDLARQIVEDRKANPGSRKDLLTAMLNGHDAQTGKTLTAENIMQQMNTFLIAGHETTSGFLSFIMFYVLSNPEVHAKLRAEVDAVVGQERMRPEHLSRLPYMTAVMRETMRLKSTIPLFMVTPFEDEVIGGKYLIKKGTNIMVGVSNIHRDKEVYGEDAEEFKPGRMLDGKFEALPPKAWIPFGNGQRACIGRAFAWQETQLAVATLFQKFDLRLVDPDYKLQLNQTLTIKPKNLRIYATPRTDTTFNLGLGPTPTTSRVSKAGLVQDHTGAVTAHSNLKPMHVFFGSNTGSCEMFAQRLANGAPAYGFRASLGTLDSMKGEIPTDGPVIIITASFEGEPPDNAGQFVKSIEAAPNDSAPFADVRYAVFGCGNRDWVHTYQRIPTLVDATLAAKGAQRLLVRGEADAGGHGFFESFDEWESKLWPILVDACGAIASEDPTAGLDVNISAPTKRASTLRQEDAQLGTVVANKLLTKPGAIGSEKRHLEFKLPEDMTYRAGDYLAILPTNPPSSVKRVLARFNLTPEQEISISSSTPTTLPVGHPVNVSDLFSGYVELAQPATRKNIEALLRRAPDTGTTHDALVRFLADYVPAVLEKRLSVLHLLEVYPDIDISLSAFLSMLPAMRVRQYSISSSPLWDPTRVTLTIGVLREAALGDSQELFQGVASTYLASLTPGDRVQMAVRPSAAAFHLPADPATPIVMFASGSGIAPMRGFMQERAEQKAAGREVGKMLLFYGCRSPEYDFLYGDAEIASWISEGVVEVRPAFSRATERSEGCKYVQDRVLHDREDVIDAFRQGAKLYTCGSIRVAMGVKAACMRIIEDIHKCDEHANSHDPELKTADDFWAKVVNERYAADVFG
ncbi:cytochrome P450 [Exidia glandulosa HHB12029]|uniref:Cytochrome P450 n=1 Tax=Exidia glandulosa HHB12029 TaxID=1314781 RepID=A0A165QDK9_EXIGL|nr:cytochrome P450 [Exidia glandulosa HHB12029]